MSEAKAAEAPSLINVTIDGQAHAFPKGTLLVEAVRQAGHPVPFYCYHPKLKPAGACRVCMVAVQGAPLTRPGQGPIVTTSCTTPVFEGLEIQTMSGPAQEARRQVLEFLLINHPLDCPICDKGGECDLQDFTLGYGPGVSRYAEAKIHRKKAHELGPFLVLDQERCIMCQRCVRYEDEVLGERNLVLHERGDRTVINTGRGEPYAGHFSGNNTELCPVGALTSQTYRFKARPWDLRRVDSVCQGCSLGCNVSVQMRGDRIVRLLSRDNPTIDGGWLCDRGRYGFGTVFAETRLVRPLVRRDGELIETSWEAAIGAVRKGLDPEKGVGVLGGGRLTNEEAYALGKLARLGFGTSDLDWRTGQQGVARPEAIGAVSAVPADLDSADLIVLVDTCLGEEAPVLDLRLRRVRGTVIDLGPRRNRTVGRAERIACAPEELAQAVAGLAGRVQAATAPVIVWNGWGGQELSAAIAALGGKVLLAGEFDNALGAEAAGLCAELLPGYRGSDDPAARAEVEGVWGRAVPQGPGRGASQILAAAAAGELGALYLVGSNPLGTFPDGELVARALEAVPFLVVQDLFLTETAHQADVVLPARGPLEKDGHITSIGGTIQSVVRVANGPDGTRTDLEVFALLGQAFGVGLPSRPADVRSEMEHLAAAVEPARAALPAGTSAVPPGRGLRVLARTQLFAGGGTAAFDPNLQVARSGLIFIHPKDAAAAGVADGQSVHLESDAAVLRGIAQCDPGVQPGFVVVAAHAPGSNRIGPWVRLAPAGQGEAGPVPGTAAAMGVRRP